MRLQAAVLRVARWWRRTQTYCGVYQELAVAVQLFSRTARAGSCGFQCIAA